MKRIIIQGSARDDGNTAQVIAQLKLYIEADVLDLTTKNIGSFDYEFNNQDDDFSAIIREIADHYDMLIFATPVYWYAMSGTMKIFFDRISDCLKIDKPTGRKLRGKTMAAISCGSDSTEIEGFFVPFASSADYLGMNYAGHIHTWIDEAMDEENKDRIKSFARVLG